MKKTAIIIAIAFGSIFAFVYLHNAFNDKFEVTFFNGAERPGYESTPASAKIQTSPALAWQHTATWAKIITPLLVLVSIFGLFFSASDKYEGRAKVSENKQTGWKAYLIIWGPMLLGTILLFANYPYANSYVGVNRDRFDNWVKTGAIEQKGEKTYVDKSDSIKNVFKNKTFFQ